MELTLVEDSVLKDDQFLEATRLVREKDYAGARAAFCELERSATLDYDKSIIANNLAVLDLLLGKKDGTIRSRLQAAAQMGSQLQAAQANLEAAGSLNSNNGLPAGMKVAILSLLYNWPSTGGGNIHSAELGLFLSRAGCDVRQFFARYSAWGIGNVVDPPFQGDAIEFDDSSWNLTEIKSRFRRAVDAFDPDLVIVADSWSMKPHLADAVSEYPYVFRFQGMECICPLNGVRLFNGDDGLLRQCPYHQFSNREVCRGCIQKRGHHAGGLQQADRELSQVERPEYYDLLLRTMAGAAAVLVVNPLQEAMLSPYSKNVRVVTAGMDPTRFPWPPHEVGTEKKVILFAGVVEDLIKGFHVLRNACAILWKKRQDFELVATGEAPQSPEPFVRYMGWQSQQDLPIHLREAAIVVMPSIVQEALGRTAVEAMAAGRPVIASRLGGFPFTVIDGTTGLLFEPGDPNDLATRIGVLLDDPSLRQRMGLAGRRRFEEHYSWDVIIERHYRPLLRSIGVRKRGAE